MAQFGHLRGNTKPQKPISVIRRPRSANLHPQKGASTRTKSHLSASGPQIGAILRMAGHFSTSRPQNWASMRMGSAFRASIRCCRAGPGTSAGRTPGAYERSPRPNFESSARSARCRQAKLLPAKQSRRPGLVPKKAEIGTNPGFGSGVGADFGGFWYQGLEIPGRSPE